MAAVIKGYDRKDEKYVKFLEDEFCHRQKEDDLRTKMKEDPTDPSKVNPPPHHDLTHITQSLQMITDRLGKLELQSSQAPTGQDTANMAASAADLIAAPLTQALAKLAWQDDDKGMLLRPEHYAQSHMKVSQQDYTTMDTIDLF